MQDLAATLSGAMAHRRGMATGQLLAKLRRVARELDNVRTVTWSADLSDSLGRAQIHARNLLQRVEIYARQEAGNTSCVGKAVRDLYGDSPRVADGDKSPYLTI